MAVKEDMFEREDGFGLTEVLVAMLLLGIIAISFVPFMLNSLKSVDRDMTIASATQIVNERLNLAKNAGIQGCEAFKGAVSEINSATNYNLNDSQPLTDGRGLELTASTTLSDFDGNVLDIGAFDCEAYLQVSVHVTGSLRGKDDNYTFARASAYVRITDATSEGGAP